MWRCCVLLFFFISSISAQNYKICAKPGTGADCQGIDKGNSNVQCVPVTDSIDCLIKMDENKADFAVMTAEELILASVAKSDKFSVVASVKYEDRIKQKFAFQSVALVKSTHTNGIQGLAGGKLCHPGYGMTKEQLWSSRVLKYFEKRTIGAPKCDPKAKTSAEDDAIELSKFYSDACRPGPWLHDPNEDKKLKNKFPSLCSLCTSNRSPDCTGYRYFEPVSGGGVGTNSHLSAIECLKSGKGTVAYVAYEYVLQYFKNNQQTVGEYSLLCEDGSIVPLDTTKNETECAWVQQAWSAVLCKKERAPQLLENLKQWMPTGRFNGDGWIRSLEAILFKDKNEILDYVPNAISPLDYISKGRQMPSVQTSCRSPLRWCTINKEEYVKCSWIHAASITLGIEPEIKCIQGYGAMDCLENIKQNRADFISVDSNYGFIARKYYNSTAVLYHETTRSNMSSVLAVIKESDKGIISRFENLRNKTACFPEYGGIAWVAFMRAAHENKVINARECDYGAEISKFFGGACAPGARDPAHHPSRAADPNKLCSACRDFQPRGTNEEGLVNQRIFEQGTECPANSSNLFYGNRGALRCLTGQHAHVAFVEGQNLKEHARNLSINPNDFFVLCRNGSLANYPGFDVDPECAFSISIDGEVISRRGDSKVHDIQQYLLDVDNFFGYGRNIQLINMEIFSEFNNSKDLLFKDNTIGLVSSDSENEYVTNYIDLFKHTESCTGGAYKLVLPSFLIVIMTVFTLVMQN